MMALEAPRLNIDMKFLDGSGGACPAAQVVGVAAAAASDYDNARIVEGGLYDAEKLRELSKGCDVVTMEIEHVGVEGLAQLENEGVNVQPSSRVIRIIQDKFAQKVCERLCAMMIDHLSLSILNFMLSTTFSILQYFYFNVFRNTSPNTTFLFHHMLTFQILRLSIRPRSHLVFRSCSNHDGVHMMDEGTPY